MLSDYFTLKEIKEKALSDNIADSSLYRYLLQLIETKHLEKAYSLP